jgi:hypothetical protein
MKRTPRSCSIQKASTLGNVDSAATAPPKNGGR